MYEYTGGGQNAYYPGVPARDLTNKEYRALPANVKEMGLYKYKPGKPGQTESEEDAVAVNEELLAASGGEETAAEGAEGEEN